jgi:hypothetical protein
VIDNATARSVVTFNAPKSLYGSGLSSNPAKGATSGILASLARFSAKKDMGVGEQLLLTHALILTSPPPS